MRNQAQVASWQKKTTSCRSIGPRRFIPRGRSRAWFRWLGRAKSRRTRPRASSRPGVDVSKRGGSSRPLVPPPTQESWRGIHVRCVHEVHDAFQVRRKLRATRGHARTGRRAAVSRTFAFVTCAPSHRRWRLDEPAGGDAVVQVGAQARWQSARPLRRLSTHGFGGFGARRGRHGRRHDVRLFRCPDTSFRLARYPPSFLPIEPGPFRVRSGVA